MQGIPPYADFLATVIAHGSAEASERFAASADAVVFEGTWDGLTACRGLEPDDLLDLRDEARAKAVAVAKIRQADWRYWRARADGIEWVLVVVNAARIAQGERPSFPPCARTAEKAFYLLGMAG